MIRCYKCIYFFKDKNKKCCEKCQEKIYFGEITEEFIECCEFFKLSDKDKARLKYYEKLKKLPIIDVGIDTRDMRKSKK